ncbi:hypothetical protein [Capnocytophaga gingivalis]
MDNSFFIFTDDQEIIIERFHICTWEFNNSKPLIEFGAEISKDSIHEDTLSISIFIPWLTERCEIKDLYEKLKDRENSRFIFNDSIKGDETLDAKTDELGVIHEFLNRDYLCILPIKTKIEAETIYISIDLRSYKEKKKTTNIYFRFLIEPIQKIPMIKNGIGKSTIIYDIKVNEQRNIPSNKVSSLNKKIFSKIKSCFLFNIIPNKYDIVFFENKPLKNIRTLEYDSFKRYLPYDRVRKDDLIVVFNKKKSSELSPSYSFFTIYSKERIGMGQFALAILINIICGFLLFLPSYRKTFVEGNPWEFWKWFTIEIYFAFSIIIFTALYFSWSFWVYIFKKYLTKSKQN